MKRFMKKLGLAAFGIALAATLTACGNRSSSKSSAAGSDLGLQQSGTLTVGLEGTFKPYSYRKDGK